MNTRGRVVHIILQVRTREQMFNDLWSATDVNDFSRLGHRLSNIKLYHSIRVQVRICEYNFKFYDVSPHILMMISLLWGRRMSNMRTFITNLHWQLHHTIRALILWIMVTNLYQQTRFQIMLYQLHMKSIWKDSSRFILTNKILFWHF